jgi:triacylglycerol lipase
MASLVLAHGILGFGAPQLLPFPFSYFNGVQAHCEHLGHRVVAPQVNPVGSIAGRGEQLGQLIKNLRRTDSEKFHIIAHSMGGLDARYALARVDGVKAIVSTLVTIGTPHEGSEVADAIASRTGPLFAALQPFLTICRLDVDGLQNLTTDSVRQFNKDTPDVEGIRYIDVAGDASKGGHELLLFQVAERVGHLTNQPNDGVVTRRSALRDGYEHLADWPVDHAGEVGWMVPPVSLDLPLTGLFGRAHLARYEDIVARL